MRTPALFCFASIAHPPGDVKLFLQNLPSRQARPYGCRSVSGAAYSGRRFNRYLNLWPFHGRKLLPDQWTIRRSRDRMRMIHWEVMLWAQLPQELGRLSYETQSAKSHYYGGSVPESMPCVGIGCRRGERWQAMPTSPGAHGRVRVCSAGFGAGVFPYL